MPLNPNETTDEKGRPIRPVLSNTAKDGSGTWYFALVDSDGHAQVDIVSETGAYTTPTHSVVTIGVTTTVVLAANTSRLYALVVNDSNETMYIKMGANAVLNQGIRLNANGGNYEISKKAGNLYTGAINGICASGTKVCLVTEGV